MKRKKILIMIIFMIMFSAFFINKTEVYARSNYQIETFEISSFKIKNGNLTIIFHDGKTDPEAVSVVNKSVSPSPYWIHPKSLTFKIPKKTKLKLKTTDLEYKKLSYKKIKNHILADRICYQKFLKKNNLKHSKEASSKFFRYTINNEIITHTLFFTVRKGKILKDSFCVVEDGYNILRK